MWIYHFRILESNQNSNQTCLSLYDNVVNLIKCVTHTPYKLGNVITSNALTKMLLPSILNISFYELEEQIKLTNTSKN